MSIEEKITLKNTRYMDGKPRINSATFKYLPDGCLMIFLQNGKSKETQHKRTASILIDERNLRLLKDFLDGR